MSRTSAPPSMVRRCAEIQRRRKEDLCAVRYTYRQLRVGGPGRSQARRKGVHRRREAARRNVRGSCVARRPQWCSTGLLTEWDITQERPAPLPRGTPYSNRAPRRAQRVSTRAALPDGRPVSTSMDGTTRLWDPARGVETTRLVTCGYRRGCWLRDIFVVGIVDQAVDVG